MKYFTEDEFAKAVPSCKIEDCNPTSLARLDRAREVAGIPFVLLSAFRTSAYDRAKGRSGKGAHTHGRAFDIRCCDSRSRWCIVFAALSVGFTRIGISQTFIHLDDDPDLSNPVIWLY